MPQGDDPHDPFAGYRPDMDQYRNVNEEIDGAYRMLGNLIIAVLVILLVGVLYGIYRLL